jgi:hypothetical protein
MATPYVISSDLVSAYPAKSLEIAQYIDGFKADLALVQNAQTGTTYSFVAADFTKLVTLSNASPVAVTLPLEATVPWAAGTQLRLLNQGAGTVTVAGDVGVTINGTPLTLAQYKGANLIKTGTDTWTFLPFSGGSARCGDQQHYRCWALITAGAGQSPLMAHFAQVDEAASCATPSSSQTLIAAAALSRVEPIGQAFINGPHPDCLALEGEWRRRPTADHSGACFAGLGYTFDGTNFMSTGRPRGHAMSWKLAAAAVTLRDQVNKRYPKRDRASDGTIGNLAHRRRISDHNPDKTGYVMALDLDEDGWPAHQFADQLIEYMRTSGDKRIRTSCMRAG